MRSTFKILYYINRSKVKVDGTTAIMCRITIDGKNSVFATGWCLIGVAIGAGPSHLDCL